MVYVGLPVKDGCHDIPILNHRWKPNAMLMNQERITRIGPELPVPDLVFRHFVQSNQRGDCSNCFDDRPPKPGAVGSLAIKVQRVGQSTTE